MATAKSKKPTDDEILAALRVLEECGSRDDYAYQKLTQKLPKAKRPPTSNPIMANLSLIGNEDIYDLPNATMDKIEAAVKNVWKPVNIKIGAKTYTIEFNEIEF